MYNPDLVDELKAKKEASWLSYMFDSDVRTHQRCKN